MSQTEMPDGKYLYGVIRCAEPRSFSTLGIGQRGDVVHTVNHEQLAAVVSDSPVVEYDNNRRNMMAHTLVLEEVMKGFTLLPVRFGTIATDERSIVDKVLARRYGELHGLINHMAGKVELGLKVFWYEEIIFQEILDENPPIRDLRDGLATRRPEETYYERLELGERIEKAMWRKRDEDAEMILSVLRPIVCETKANKVITDRMVLNAAFLLKEERQTEFDSAVRRLDKEMGHRLIFKYVGPVPPYNFVNIVVAWEE